MNQQVRNFIGVIITLFERILFRILRIETRPPETSSTNPEPSSAPANNPTTTDSQQTTGNPIVNRVLGFLELCPIYRFVRFAVKTGYSSSTLFRSIINDIQRRYNGYDTLEYLMNIIDNTLINNSDRVLDTQDDVAQFLDDNQPGIFRTYLKF